MSGERPAPLWPEGLRKRLSLPPVESQRPQAPPTGESSRVPKQGEVIQPREQRPIRRGRTRPEGQEAPGTISREHGGEQPEQTAVVVPRRRRQRGEQKGQAELAQPTPAEQQTPQRRRTQRERARLAQDPELRRLARELFGDIGEEGVSEFIEMAVHDYPELPPDEALTKWDRDSREGGFSFA